MLFYFRKSDLVIIGQFFTTAKFEIIRLNLIECPSGKHLTDINWYRMYYDDEFMQELRNKIEIMDGYELVQIPKVFAPTSFGKKFYEICVE